MPPLKNVTIFFCRARVLRRPTVSLTIAIVAVATVVAAIAAAANVVARVAAARRCRSAASRLATRRLHTAPNP